MPAQARRVVCSAGIVSKEEGPVLLAPFGKQHTRAAAAAFSGAGGGHGFFQRALSAGIVRGPCQRALFSGHCQT